ncbi:unnamed protein product [Ascophyllum nodosum]
MSEVDIPDEAKGKPKMKNQMSEVDVPDEEAQEQKTAEKTAASNPEHDKGSSDFGNEKEVILAEGLGTQAMEFLDSSFGIELILEANSLETEIKEQVVVKPGMKFVTCEDERDTSRTHDELLEWSSKDDDGEMSDTSTLNFLLMPIVHGPSDVTFHPDRPAKLRYFVGNLEDLQDEIRGDGGGDCSLGAVAEHLRQVYEPLISADREKWRMLPPFQTIFKKRRNEATGVWLETRLYHFSEGSIGQLIDCSKLDPIFRTYEGKMPFRFRWWGGHRRDVLFGNDTQEVLIFYALKQENVMATDRGGRVGAGAGTVNVTGERHQGVTVQNLDVDGLLKCVVPAGQYVTMPMPIGGNWVHQQIVYSVFFCEQPSVQPPNQRRQFYLKKDRLNKGRMVIVRQQFVSWRRSDDWPEARGELTLDASLQEVREFLSKF